MTQTHTIDVSQEVFPFSSIENLSTILRDEKPARISRKNTEGVMELPVNNYLKTPDEIEMEFRYGINPRKLNLRKESLNDVASITKTDGYLNIHNLDEALSGFMEENY
jgi:hypothetical protein